MQKKRYPKIVTGSVLILATALACSGCTHQATPPGSEALGGAELAVISEETADEVSYVAQEQTLDKEVAAAQGALDSAVSQLESEGAQVGYYLIDIASGEVIEHNAAVQFYSASSIKGPFCISLLRAKGWDARNAYGSSIERVVSNSDNDAYDALRSTYYPAEFFQAFIAESGANCDPIHWYTHYTVCDLAKLWHTAYGWLSSDDENAIWLANLFTDSLNSQVDDASAGISDVTWSKAGWYAGGGPRYDVTFDGGIVNTPNGSCALAVATGRGSDFDAVRSVMEPLVRLWSAQTGA